VAFLLARPARADDRATAQELFARGRELMASGRVEEACSKFAACAELTPTAGVRLNLGECYARLGRPASAWTWYAEALTVAERAGDTAAAEIARTRQRDLQPRLAYITVTASEAAPGIDLSRDGKRLPPAAWGLAVPVDPGEHTVEAVARGHEAWKTIVRVSEPGARIQVSVPQLAPLPEKEAVHHDPGVVDGAGGRQRVGAVVVAGLGGAALATGAAFGVLMLVDRHDYESKLVPGSGRCPDTQCQSTSSDAVTTGNIATGALVAGAALATTGLVLWLTAPRSSRAEVSASAQPHGGTLVVRGSFW
jgi:hypothetical protein